MSESNRNNKTALISGSTQGIGLAIAQKLSSQGYGCVLLARNEERLREVIKTLSGPTQNHHYLVADFNDPESLKAVVNSFVAKHPVSVLINNTGGPAGGAVFTAKTEEFVKAFRMHILCNQILAQLIVPYMKESGFGRIVNIISTSVRIPIPNLGVSNTIRGAVASWAKTLSNELAPFGITVNNILPGYTQTARLNQILHNRMEKEGKSLEEVEKDLLKLVPMNRFGLPEEIAAAAAFFISPDAGYITGVSLPVDGGRTGCI